jgi:hypothetical protein
VRKIIREGISGTPIREGISGFGIIAQRPLWRAQEDMSREFTLMSHTMGI